MDTASDEKQKENYSTCSNPRCNCAVSEGEDYCCDNCAEQVDDDSCQCGHSQCQAE